jgi:hypothetical protein
MPGLVPGIHVLVITKEDVDGRDKPGHYGGKVSAAKPTRLRSNTTSGASQNDFRKR